MSYLLFSNGYSTSEEIHQIFVIHSRDFRTVVPADMAAARGAKVVKVEIRVLCLKNTGVLFYGAIAT
jgi:hypothetical protein